MSQVYQPGVITVMALRSLMETCPSCKKEQVAALVAEHLGSGAGGLDKNEVSELNSAIEEAYDSLGNEAKQQISKSLASSAATSNSLALRLAQETVQIAAPILTNSPVLSTADLKKLVREQSAEHRLAISKREVLDREVTELLIALGDNEINLSVSANLGADIAQEDFERLVRAMPAKMGSRIGHLRKSNDLVVQDLLRDKADLVLGADLEERVTSIPFDQWLSAVELGQINLDAAVSRMCTEKNLHDVVRLLSEISGMSHDNVTCLMLRTDAMGIAVLCKTLGVGSMEYSILSRVRCIHLRLPQFMGELWARNFNILSPDDAKRLYGLLMLKLQKAEQKSSPKRKPQGTPERVHWLAR